MTECRELAGKIIESFRLYLLRRLQPEVNIDFTDSTALNVFSKRERFIEAKHPQSGEGEPRLLQDNFCPVEGQ